MIEPVSTLDPEERFCRKRPDDMTFRKPTKTKSGVFCILEFNHTSGVTDQYTISVRQAVEDQYVSLRTVLRDTLQHQGWVVKQVSFTSKSRSLNEHHLFDNLQLFKVPCISKLDLKIYSDGRKGKRRREIMKLNELIEPGSGRPVYDRTPFQHDLRGSVRITLSH